MFEREGVEEERNLVMQHFLIDPGLLVQEDLKELPREMSGCHLIVKLGLELQESSASVCASQTSGVRMSFVEQQSGFGT